MTWSVRSTRESDSCGNTSVPIASSLDVLGWNVMCFSWSNLNVPGFTDKHFKMVTALTGWWFGTWLLFFHLLGMSSSQLTNSIIFQRGRSTTNQFRKVITLWNWHLRNWPLWKLRDRIYHQFGWPKSRLHSKPNICLLVNHSNPQDYVMYYHLRAAAPAADPGKNTRRFVTQHSFSVLFFLLCRSDSTVRTSTLVALAIWLSSYTT